MKSIASQQAAVPEEEQAAAPVLKAAAQEVPISEQDALMSSAQNLQEDALQSGNADLPIPEEVTAPPKKAAVVKAKPALVESNQNPNVGQERKVKKDPKLPTGTVAKKSVNVVATK